MTDKALTEYGFVPFFAQQASLDELEGGCVRRVTEVQRSELTVSNGVEEQVIPHSATWHDSAPEQRPTVGDWVVLDTALTKIERVLERKSVFRRVAAGERSEVQLIAANIDILFIVTSCNDDFNESRLERYLALAAEAGVFPVVVLSKIDLVEDAHDYAERARRIQPGLAVETVNALDETTLGGVRAWIEAGSTVALVGSSGVGKSTLLNALADSSVAATNDIREQDQKGRHTTSHRALYRLPTGGLLIDVPGMRELKVADVGNALGVVFDEIEALARDCKFANCEHASEPGCAVQSAIEAGEINPRRLQNYLKLQREDERNSASIAERRSQGKGFAKLVKQAVAQKRGKDK